MENLISRVGYYQEENRNTDELLLNKIALTVPLLVNQRQIGELPNMLAFLLQYSYQQLQASCMIGHTTQF